jgi:hypothetical protein
LLSLIWLVGNAFATNLVVNGDFETGNTGFTSDYGYVDSIGPTALYEPNTYAIGSSPQAYHQYWSDFGPHDGSKMMIVNGGILADKTVWSQAVTVAANTNYSISFWVASNFNDPSPGVIDFKINNVAIGTITATSNAGDWTQFTCNWFSGAITTANLSIIDTNITYSGNDFSIDGITMNAVPLPPSVLLLASGLLGMVGWRRFRKG